MEMLRRYAMNYEVMHKNQFEVNFVEEVKRFCVPESHTRYKDFHTDMQTGKPKSSFSQKALNARRCDPEWDNFDEKINSFMSYGGKTIWLLWEELNEAILKHLNAEKWFPAKLMTIAAQSTQTQSSTGS